MGMSTYLQNALLSEVLRNTDYVPPTTVYLALYTSDPTIADVGTEADFTGYARQSIAFNALAGGTTANTSDVAFPACTSGSNAITHVGLRDAVTAGNLLFSGVLTTSQTVVTDTQFIVKAGQITDTLT